MPIEIKQMYININVGVSKSSAAQQDDDNDDDDSDDYEEDTNKQSGVGQGEDIQECIDAVLEILNNKKER